MKHNPLEFSFDTFPGLDAELDAAFAQNAQSEIEEPLAVVTQAALAEAQPLSPDSDRPDGADLPPTLRPYAEATKLLSDLLFDKIGISVPSLNEFQTFGVNFQRLSTAYETMHQLDLQPQLVIAPMLPLASWKELFQKLYGDPIVNADGRIKYGGLWVSDEVVRSWDGLQGSKFTLSPDIGWQVLVIPGTTRPSVTNVNHTGMHPGRRGRTKVADTLTEYYRQLDITTVERSANIHPTIPAYLTMQASHLLGNIEPTDGNTYSWLEGQFYHDKWMAPEGNWDTNNGRVVLGNFRVECRLSELGVRLPVWG